MLIFRKQWNSADEVSKTGAFSVPHFNHHSSLSNRIYCSPLSNVSASYLTLPLKMSKDVVFLSLGCRMQRETLIYLELLLQERGPPPLHMGAKSSRLKVAVLITLQKHCH